MSMTKKIFLSLFLVICTVCLAFAVTACNKENGESSDNPSAGTSDSVYGLGEEDWYYYDSAESRYYLSLQSGAYNLYMGSDMSSSGTYTFDEMATSIAFTSVDGTSFSAPYVAGNLSLNFGTSGYTFQRYVYFDVTYVGRNSEIIATEKVLNGQPAVRIEAKDESADGYYFVNWYSDEEMTIKYGFNVSVTRDTVVYGRYISVDSDAMVFDVTYDYTGHPTGSVTATTTMNGKIYDLPEEDGLLGWWVSATNKSDELTYRFIEGETVLYENTTLFAVWEGALGASVTADGVTWEAVVGSETSVTIRNAEGSVVLNDSALSSTKSFTSSAFATLGTGKYTVTVASGDQSETLVYIVGGLARVSRFTVEGRVLVYNSVPDATNYYVYIDCGSENHHHGFVDNGTSLVYDFSDCDMPAEGINFVVYAYADGMLASESETFNYYDGFDELTVTVSDDVASWAVAVSSDGTEATAYEIYVNGELAATTAETKYSLEYYEKGTSLEIRIRPVAKGCYSEASEITTYVKIRLATPIVTGFIQGSLTWTKSEGATGYRVYISGNSEPFVINGGETTTFITSEDNFTKNGAYENGKGSYEIYVVAIGETESVNSRKSETITVTENEMNAESLTYADGVVSWTYVLNADSYLIKVNDEKEYGDTYSVTGHNSCEISFTKEGENTVAVYFMSTGTQSTSYATLTVTAYALTLDYQGGSAEVSGATDTTMYLAVGDTVRLPDATAPEGYNFAGWYTLADSVTKTADSPVYYEGDGVLYADGTEYDGTVSMLYAFYAPRAYTVTFVVDEGEYLINSNGKTVYGADGKTPATSYTVTAYYDRRFELLSAAYDDAIGQFAGWYTEREREGTLYSGGDVWKIASDMTFYSGYYTVLVFTLTRSTYNGEDVYAVSKGTDTKLVSEITVPASYNGIKVAQLPSNAFTDCTALTRINLPDTIEYISVTNNGYSSGCGAFAGCSKLEEVNIIPSEGNFERFYYSDDDGVLYRKTGESTAELLYYPRGKSGGYEVPEIVYNSAERDAIDGDLSYSVTTIPTRLFYTNTSLTGLTLPATVTKVESQAFASCTKLATLTFKAVATSGIQATSLTLGDDVFLSCTRLASLTLPTYLDEFDYSKLYKCSSLVDVYISGSGGNYLSRSEEDLSGIVFDGTGSTIVYFPIGRTSYYDDDEDEYVYIEFTITETNITGIGDYAFYGNTGLKKLTIPAWVTKIGAHAFEGCTNLSTITFSSNDLSNDLNIGTCAFYGCTSLASVTLPENLTGLAAYSFGGCTKLKTVSYNARQYATTEQLSGLERYAFSSSGARTADSYVTELTLGANVPEIEFLSIFGGPNLATVNITEGNTAYKSEDSGVILSYDGTRISFIPSTISGAYTVSVGVTRIDADVFSGKTGITSVTIPTSVYLICQSAFSGCTNLVSVTFSEPSQEDTDPQGLFIEDAAFSGCTSLTAVSLPARLDELGTDVFYGCTQLSSVTVGEGNAKFESKENLLYALDSSGTAVKILVCPMSNSETEIEIYGTVDGIGDSLFAGNTIVTKITFTTQTVPSTFSIGVSAFEGCTSLATANLPEGIVSLSERAFYGCSSLTGFNMPASVKEVGGSAFSGCSSLSEMDFSSVETLGTNVCDGCSSLKTVTVGTKIKEIPAYAFRGTTALETVTFTAKSSVETFGFSSFSRSGIKKITLPDSMGEIGECAFMESQIEEIELNDGLFWVDEEAFMYCTELTSIEVPSSITWLAFWAFCGCTSLKKVTFDEPGEDETPATLILHAYLFEGCTSLEEITIPSRTITLDVGAFSGCTSLRKVTLEEGMEVKRLYQELFYGCTSLESIDVPYWIEEIWEEAFKDCTALKTVTGCESITEVGQGAFWGCSSLTDESADLVMKNIEDLNMNTFSECTSLKNVTVGEQVECIYMYAFWKCTALESVTVPVSVSARGVNFYAFNGCSSLSAIYYEGDDWSKVLTSGSLPSGVTVYCYSENEPTVEGDWWYRDDATGLPAVWGSDAADG